MAHAIEELDDKAPWLDGGTAPERVEVEDRVVGRPGMSRRMRRCAAAVAEALFATKAGAPPHDRIVWLCDDVDDFLVHAGPRARLVFRACLWAIATVAPLLVKRLPPFRRLSLERRVEALEHMEAGFLGLAVFGAKAMLCLCYYEHPDALAEIGCSATGPRTAAEDPATDPGLADGGMADDNGTAANDTALLHGAGTES